MDFDEYSILLGRFKKEIWTLKKQMTLWASNLVFVLQYLQVM